MQSQIPVILPVIDYNYTFDRPILGGELGYRLNFTSLTRQDADFDPITQLASNNGTCSQTANPAIKNTANCLLRGVPGTYTRFSAETQWRRRITDQFGQVFTPVRVSEIRCGGYADQEPARRRQLHSDRRRQSRARNADRRTRISVPVHQHSVMGYADG